MFSKGAASLERGGTYGKAGRFALIRQWMLIKTTNVVTGVLHLSYGVGMKEIPKISDAEWEVMNVLWDEPGLTAALVGERLSGRGWKLNTVRTFLTRLERKGAVRVQELPEARVFSAVLSREECIHAEGRTFAQRFFQGATGALLVHFAGNTKLSERELNELEEILERKRKEGGRGRR